ncbi:MAG: iron export ABC transporter permease subunit FetB [Leptolyngbya sp. SIO4C1]|nr:iron export ABC transporter permease subunit FetB [Leptolyngbya sp. SIO4C1]
MNTEIIELDPIRIAWALGLMGAAIGLTAWQQLGLVGTLAIATLRTVAQLFAVGLFLSIIFALRSPWLVLLVLAVMLTVAALTARNRIGKDLPRLLPWLWGAIFTSAALTISYTTLAVVRPDTWYEPRYLIPLTGIVFGNAMNAASIAGNRLVSALCNSRVEIETHLSLGATPEQAIAGYRREAIKAGLIPTVNAMMVVGLVTLPGIITGQLLSGVDPLNAALYQMLIMFMLAFSTLTAAVLTTYGIKRQFFNAAAQLVEPRR